MGALKAHGSPGPLRIHIFREQAFVDLGATFTKKELCFPDSVHRNQCQGPSSQRGQSLPRPGESN